MKQVKIKENIPNYKEENKDLYIAAKVFSVVFNILLIATAFSFLSDWFIKVLTLDVYFAYGLSVLLLGGLELVQRGNSKKLFRAIVRGDFSSIVYIRMFILIFISSISIWASFNGSEIVVDQRKVEIPYTPPELIDLDQIRKDYSISITAVSEEIEYYKKTKWNALLFSKASKRMDGLMGQLRGDLKEATSQNDQLIKESKKEFQEKVTSQKVEVLGYGQYLGAASLLFQVLFFVVIWFIEIYKSKGEIKSVVEEEKVLEAPELQKPQPIEKQGSTVEHNGKQIGIKDIKKNISTYTKRVEEAINDNKKQQVIDNRKGTLNYWKEKEVEYLKKN